jgi:serine/threonine-protein kinase HipA
MKEGHPLLHVYWEQELVGTLWSTATHQICFSYASPWVDNKKPKISLSMPVRVDSYQDEAQSFFGNLLPEGDFRRRIEQMFKISPNNDFSLLKEIGGDCAGALSIGAAAEADDEAFYEPISDEMLARIIKSEGVAGLGQAGHFNRLSLAGAQGKLPVRFRQRKFEIPHKGAASTHILKFNHQSGEYPKLVENEYYMNRVAHHMGLSVVNCELQRTSHGTILVIERYDRSTDDWPRRYHQEDFCQALGVSYLTKYEKEGGPSLADCIKLVRRYLGILDVNSLIDWYLFNLFMGNSDAHAKNISILHGRNGPRLAPFYDLICTRAYERLDRKLAMACGGEYDPDLVSLKNLETLATDIGVTFRFLRSRINGFLDKVPDALQQAAKDFVAQGYEWKTLQHVEECLKKIHRGFAKRLVG